MSCCDAHILKALKRERAEGRTPEILRILRGYGAAPDAGASADAPTARPAQAGPTAPWGALRRLFAALRLRRPTG